jgi:phosphopantothenoylcysteine decarboxylase/phosphopantothenate--cysteine ligase
MQTLLARGVRVVGPQVGDMACGEFGAGRMAEVPEILAAVDAIAGARPLAGRHAVVTVGATAEPIDPVRFISNHSSGRQGLAIAGALARAGARVTLVHGRMDMPPPAGMTAVFAPTAGAMASAVEAALPADIFVAAAAVADFAPAEVPKQKIKKAGGEGLTLTLQPTVDVLKTTAQHPMRPKLVIGFALESDNHLAHAREKLARKGADWLVLNDASAMQSHENRITLLRGTDAVEWPTLSKESVAHRLADEIVNHFAKENPDAALNRSGDI